MTNLCKFRGEDKCEGHACSLQPLPLHYLRITPSKFALVFSDVLWVETSTKYRNFIQKKTILVISQVIAEDTSGIQRIRENVNWAEKSRTKARTMHHQKTILAYSAWKFDRLEMIILRGIAKL